VFELGEMEGERGRGELQTFGDLPGWQSFRAGLHEQPEDLEAVPLGERSERRNGLGRFHVLIYMEILD
jgi:hypothetical protein